MKTIDLRNIASSFSSNSDALPLYALIDYAIKNKQPFVLNIDNGIALSSSFLNSSIGEIITTHGLDKLKSCLKLKTSKPQFKRFSSYIQNYTTIYSA